MLTTERNLAPLTGQKTSLRYRPDIDGLRAIAVSAVVLFHAGIPGFGGGFTGVDIFFVISGYLITSLILPDIHSRNFSVAAFYQRRIRRIFPALIAVIGFCIAAGYFLQTPNDYKTLARSVVAAGLFVSNIFFWQQTSYFGAPASENPLLHTWSLSIEEQFYLFYPLFLVLIFKITRYRAAAVSLFCLLSFLACAVLIFYKPSATFYLGPTRAWELLAGGIVAMGVVPAGGGKSVSLVAAMAGLASILGGIIFYSSSMRYPGYAALAPVVGTALLIWSGQAGRTDAHRLLSTAPFTALGRASYSIYLWHFPLFAYIEYVTIGKISWRTSILVCVLSVIAGFVSLHLVERPFRFPLKKARIPQLVFISVAAMVVLVGAGAYIQFDGGIPSRMDATSSKYLDAELDKERHHYECMSEEDRIIKPADACKLGVRGVPPTALLWGDSHAMVTATAMENAAVKDHAAFLFAASVDCPPGIGFSVEPKIGPSFVATAGYQYCETYNNGMLKEALGNSGIKAIVLSSRWTNWHVGESGSPSEGTVDIRLRDGSGVASSLKANEAIFARGFDRLIQSLVAAHKAVWIVGPVPEASARVPKALYIKHIGSEKIDLDIPVSMYWKRNETILTIFSDVAKKYPISFIWPQQVLCNETKCSVSEDGNALYLDDNHLSVFGSLKTAPLYDAVFSKSRNSTSSLNEFLPKPAGVR